MGDKFPTNEKYRKTIIQYTQLIGQFLALQGVRDSFNVDFLVVRNNDSYDIYCSEINQRWGGIGSARIAVEALVDGDYDAEGRYIDRESKKEKHIVWLLISKEYLKGVTPPDIYQIIS